MVSVGAENVGSQVFDKALFEAALGGKSLVGAPQVFNAQGEFSTHAAPDDTKRTVITPFAVPIEQGGKVIGVVQAGIVFQTLAEKYIAPLRIGQAGHAFVATGVGETVYHPVVAQIMNRPAPTDLTPKMVQQRQGKIEYNWGGYDWLAFYTTSPLTNWTMIVKARRDEVFAPVKAIAMQAILNKHGSAHHSWYLLTFYQQSHSWFIT